MGRVLFLKNYVSKLQKKKNDLKDAIFFTLKKGKNLIFVLCEKKSRCGGKYTPPPSNI
jgi:hypothetical protein